MWFDRIAGDFPIVALSETDLKTIGFTNKSHEEHGDLGSIAISADSLECPLGVFAIIARHPLPGAAEIVRLVLEPVPEPMNCLLGQGGPYKPGRHCLTFQTESKYTHYFFDVPPTESDDAR